MNVTLGAASESSQLVWHFDNVTITSSSEAYDPAAGPWNFEFRRSAFAEEAEQVWADLAPSATLYTGQFQGFVDGLAGVTAALGLLVLDGQRLDARRAALEEHTTRDHASAGGDHRRGRGGVRGGLLIAAAFGLGAALGLGVACRLGFSCGRGLSNCRG